ncbi:MAG: hypothetical protein IJZ33_00155 [Clostridia bacterium]|nr:hypothetical protein [Clostridia bacterium]
MRIGRYNDKKAALPAGKTAFLISCTERDKEGRARFFGTKERGWRILKKENAQKHHKKEAGDKKGLKPKECTRKSKFIQNCVTKLL